MSGHSPDLFRPPRRLWPWLTELSDLRISLYMLLLAIVVAATLYAVNREFFS